MKLIQLPVSPGGGHDPEPPDWSVGFFCFVRAYGSECWQYFAGHCTLLGLLPSPPEDPLEVSSRTWTEGGGHQDHRDLSSVANSVAVSAALGFSIKGRSAVYGEEEEHGDNGAVGNDADRAYVVGGHPNHRLHKESNSKLVEEGCDVNAQNPNLQVVDHSHQNPLGRGATSSADH